MNRTKTFFYNTISTGIMQAVTIVAGFLVPRFMLKFYGSEINGLVSSISQFMLYFSLVEAGLANAAIYSLYKPLADNNNKEINAVISASKRFYIKAGYLFVSLTVALAVLYPIFIRTDALPPLHMSILVLVMGISGALEFFTLSKYRVLLTADQKTYVISSASTISIMANTIIIVVLSYIKVNIVLLRGIALISVFIRPAILAVYVNLKYKYIDYDEKPNNAAMSKRWDAFYLQILASIQTGAPVVIATIFTNLKIVSIYTVFNLVTNGINGVFNTFVNCLPSMFGELIVKEEKEKLQKAYRDFSILFYYLMAVIFSVTFIAIMPFIKLFTRGITDANYDLPILGFLFVLNGFVSNMKNPQGALVISAGMYKETKWQTSIQGAINLVFGIIFVNLWGLEGIMIASILSHLYRDIDLILFVSKKILGLPLRDTIKPIIHMIISILVSIIPFMFIKWNIQSYAEWIAFSVFMIAFSSVVVLLIGLTLDRKNMNYIANRIKIMVGIRNGESVRQ